MSSSSREPDLFDRAWAAFGRGVTGPIADSWRPIAATVAGVLLLALLLISAPALYLNDYALDIFIPLDGAWRMHHGQWPHADFSTPIGALYYVLLDLAGPVPTAPIRANLILLPFTLTAALVVTRARLPAPLRLALVGFVALMTLSPRSLDSLGLVSHLASYNRHGWTLTAIVFAGVLLRPRSRTRADAVVEGAMLALSTVALFYLKITFFALAGSALIIGVIAGGPNRWTSLGAGVGALAFVGLGFAVGETNALYLADLQRAAAAGAEASTGLIRADRITGIAMGNPVGFGALVAGLIWLLRSARTEAEERQAGQVALTLLAVTGLTVLVTSQSHDRAVPVLPVVLAALFATFRSRWELRGDDSWSVRVVGAVVFATLVGPMAADALAIARHTVGARSSASVPLAQIPGSPVLMIRIPASGRSDSPLTRVIEGTLPADAYDNLNPPWARDDDVILRDAVALLQAHGVADRRVASLTFSPSFPWILGTAPPRGLPAWHDFRRTFTADSVDDPAAVLADSEVVLVPQVWRIEGIVQAYRPGLEADFDRVGSTPLWTLWVRRD